MPWRSPSISKDTRSWPGCCASTSGTGRAPRLSTPRTICATRVPTTSSPLSLAALGVFRPPLGKELFNVFADTAPDRWGQNLLRRQERDRAAAANEAPRSLGSIDFLFGVKDGLRQGALRFRLPSTSNYLGVDDVGIPQIVTLPRLLAASDRYFAGGDDLKDLINAGGSLGGARPKAAVKTETGKLAIAKFPRNDDQWDVAAWEQVAADLAVLAGITMPPSRLIKVDGRNVFLVERFDRDWRAPHRLCERTDAPRIGRYGAA